VAAPRPAESTATPKPEAKAAEAKAAAPAPGTLTIQVTALRERAEAEKVAKRLAAKGYPAYVAEPERGSVMYRVRVGSFSDRAVADRMKAKLAREEKFKPWVTR
jgi:cell division septation protein DedD